MEMISFEKAYEIVMNSSFSTGTEEVFFNDSLNRILAGDVISDIDMPPFNKASVDGFACRRAELDNELEIIETIRAGVPPEKNLGINQCSRIMTGAVIPSGADCVVMVEETGLLPSGRMKFKGSFARENIARKGEDVKEGDTVLKAGKIIKPQDIAVMASAGHTKVLVSKMPVVAVISSGSELVEPDVIPGTSQIRNSNSYQLMAQAKRAGTTVKYYGIAKDDEAETFSIIERAVSESDIVLISGGVSMGDFDFVPAVMEQAGVRILFSRIAIQPGKPTTFGVHPKALIFGLPGNPVSSFMMFEMLVRPLICKMMGYMWDPVEVRLPMKVMFKRKYAERRALIPVVITDDKMVMPVEYHGSAHISALPVADGFISLKSGATTIESGEIVDVRPI